MVYGRLSWTGLVWRSRDCSAGGTRLRPSPVDGPPYGLLVEGFFCVWSQPSLSAVLPPAIESKDEIQIELTSQPSAEPEAAPAQRSETWATRHNRRLREIGRLFRWKYLSSCLW